MEESRTLIKMEKSRTMMFIQCIDFIIDKLKLLELERDRRRDDRSLKELKLGWKLVKTFVLCWKKLHHVEEIPYFLPTFEEFVGQNPHIFCEDRLLNSDLAAAAPKFQQVLKNIRQEISEEYAVMLNHLLESASKSEILSKTWDFVPWREISRVRWNFDLLDRFVEHNYYFRIEFMEFFDSLLENLEDMLIWAEASCDSRFPALLEPLHAKLLFMKNFIRFVKLRGQDKDERQLTKHCGIQAVSAARLCCICWFYRDDDQVFDGMHSDISAVIDKIKPVIKQVRMIYIHCLEIGNFDFGSSLTPLSIGTEMFIVGDFVDSLLGNLWELLTSCTNFTVTLKHQMRILYDGLRFLRNILKKELDKYNGLHQTNKDLVGAVIKDAGVLIYSLYENEMEDARAKEMDVKLLCLLEKLKLIKAEVEERYPVTARFNFPSINELGFIDLLVENLKQLESCKVDPIPFAKDTAQTIQKLILFLESYLKKIVVCSSSYLKNKAQRVQEEIKFCTSFLDNYADQNNRHEELQVQRMRKDFLFLRSFLEKTAEQHNQHEGLQALWRHVTNVAYKAEFVIDSLRVGDRSFYSLMLFDNITAEIELVKSEVSQVRDRKHVIQAPKATKILRDVPSQGTFSTSNEVVVGLDDEAEAIINQLICGSQKLEIVSIVGMAGLGKTTLAKQVYHHLQVTCCFQIRAWCCVSQIYCKKDLLLQILACITQNAQYSEMDDNDLALKLRRHLLTKEYLIVLDDIWGIEAWNDLQNSFPDDANGSRILLTSRLQDVIGNPHYLRRLTNEESWELLQKKLGSCPPALSDVGKQMAINCNGLPLSIVIISGVLATLEQDSWEEVAKRLSSNIVCGTEGCRNILELSYQHLPDHLKPCLLYFGAFSEDQEIPIKKLMLLWIAEGIVRKNKRESAEKMAEDYIMALISRSLVMVSQQRSIGGVKTCRIHDLLHEFCVLKAKEENFLQLVQGYDEVLNFDAAHNLRRLCICSQPKHFVKPRIFGIHIRSLLHSSRGVGSREVSYNLSFIFLLKLLRVLDLGQINLGFMFPSEISLLVQLRYLSVLGRMKDIPLSIENLSNLETFLVTTYYSSVGLSLPRNALWNMQTLRHLHVHGAMIDLNLAKDNLEGSCNLDNLDTFSTPNLYLGRSMETMLRKFPNIRKLKCCLSESEECTGDSSKIVAMAFLSRLESLKLLLGNVNEHHIEFHLPLNLKKLTLEDFSFSMISTIRKLPNLEVLKLLRGKDDGVEEWDMEEHEFSKIKFMKLESLHIVRWIGSGDNLPCLQKLVLEGCADLEELPSCFGKIVTLESIEVHRCTDSVGSSVREIEEEQMDWGNVDLKILISEEIEALSSWSD